MHALPRTDEIPTAVFVRQPSATSCLWEVFWTSLPLPLPVASFLGAGVQQNLEGTRLGNAVRKTSLRHQPLLACRVQSCFSPSQRERHPARRDVPQLMGWARLSSCCFNDAWTCESLRMIFAGSVFSTPFHQFLFIICSQGPQRIGGQRWGLEEVSKCICSPKMCKLNLSLHRVDSSLLSCPET